MSEGVVHAPKSGSATATITTTCARLPATASCVCNFFTNQAKGWGYRLRKRCGTFACSDITFKSVYASSAAALVATASASASASAARASAACTRSSASAAAAHASVVTRARASAAVRR